MHLLNMRLVISQVVKCLEVIAKIFYLNCLGLLHDIFHPLLLLDKDISVRKEVNSSSTENSKFYIVWFSLCGVTEYHSLSALSTKQSLKLRKESIKWSVSSIWLDIVMNDKIVFEITSIVVSSNFPLLKVPF